MSTTHVRYEAKYSSMRCVVPKGEIETPTVVSFHLAAAAQGTRSGRAVVDAAVPLP